jgi:hypothetical protein
MIHFSTEDVTQVVEHLPTKCEALLKPQYHREEKSDSWKGK